MFQNKNCQRAFFAEVGSCRNLPEKGFLVGICRKNGFLVLTATLTGISSQLLSLRLRKLWLRKYLVMQVLWLWKYLVMQVLWLRKYLVMQVLWLRKYLVMQVFWLHVLQGYLTWSPVNGNSSRYSSVIKLSYVIKLSTCHLFTYAHTDYYLLLRFQLLIDWNSVSLVLNVLMRS